jgi:NAD(P)-dependent dehydrogenase (short-subunit alcohol dehydrogenase family)
LSANITNVKPWVLVTGGAKRLGRCISQAFAEAGWGVAVHHSQSKAEAHALCDALRATGVAAQAVHGTLDDAAAVAQLFDAAQAAMGSPAQAIVCNASLFEPDTGRDVQPELLMQQLQVNLAAPMQLGSLLAKAHAARRARDGQGEQGAQGQACDGQVNGSMDDSPLLKSDSAANTAFVNHAHLSAAPSLVHVLDQKVFNLNPDYFSYTLTKLALERAVALQAQALAPQLRVNAVAPGLMFVSGPQSEANFARASRVNLMGQPIDPMDVARAAVFLASTPSCTGATLTVDMGQHLVPLGRDVMFALDHLHPGVLPGSV